MMTKFYVYEHQTLGKRAVKDGFSAAGFFFPLIWSMYHALWWLSAILFPWAIIAAAMDAILSNVGGHGLLGALLAQTIFFHIPAGLLFGLSGNGLLKSKLQKQGYKVITIIEAQSPEDAIGQVATKVAPVNNRLSSNSLADQLSSLNDLKKQGALSDAEYQSAKAKLLG